MRFEDLEFKNLERLHGVQAHAYFDNGFGVSVVRHEFSYGGRQGLYEIAVLENDDICYTSSVTNDVLGHLSEDDVTRVLAQVEALPLSKSKAFKSIAK
jgi:hypothetical protein